MNLENSRSFKLSSPYQPAGDQEQAIEKLSAGVEKGLKFQTLKGVTGSGKTFTMAKVIEKTGLPTLVISHNKTLAAQLYREFRDFFPENAVEYFVSYYDYYQPEAYVAARDLYIEKDSSINEEIDKMRLAATSSLMERKDVIVVATVSCIYGLGNPKSFRDMKVYIERGMKASPQSLSRKLIELQYERNDMILKRGGFRIKGDVMEIHPAYTADAYRIETSWDVIEKISRISPVSAEIIENLDVLSLYAAKHFVMPEDEIKKAAQIIKKEAEERYEYFVSKGKLVEAQRIKSRTDYDMEMLEEMGYCSGIENYSLHLTGRKSGDRPAVLLDYFPEKFLTFIDESHVTVPQIGGMFEGDKARKQNLVDFGFRLPSAMDNRPLYYGEFESILDRTIFVSATPSREEAAKAQALVEQIIRPTGLLDPEIFIRKTEGQMEDLYAEIRKRIEAGERTLVTTLTKKMAEDLTDFFAGLGLKVRYLHSDIETIERVEILKDLRTGTFDVLVGINLLREGLDLPEVSLVAILDADKIGFLRSATSLIQTIGRAARNVNGTVIMYADRISDAMETAVGETDRRRKIQQTYNDEHGITPRTIKKAVQDIILRRKEEKRKTEYVTLEILKNSYNIMIPKEKKALIKALEEQMLEHARRLEFEEAALVRDEIQKLKGLD